VEYERGDSEKRLSVVARMQVIESLILFSRPLSETKKTLSQLPFDYAGSPYILTANAVIHVIDLFESRIISSQELSEWAELIEMRDDIEPDSANSEIREWIIATIFSLANPELAGASIPTMIEAIRKDYQRVMQ
jgi:hypothetical protein